MNLIEQYKDLEPHDQQALLLFVELLGNVVSAFVMYRRYKKWGAPKWAARGLTGITFQLNMIQLQRKIDRLSEVRRSDV